MNKVEYLILKSALEFPEALINVAKDYNISRTEVVISANNLFQNGNILAEMRNVEDKILGDLIAEQVKSEKHLSTLLTPIFEVEKLIVLTPSQIEANLDGELGALYYLTSQGGARWESVAHPDWDRYCVVNIGFNESGEIAESQVICPSKQFVEKFLSINCYVSAVVHVPGTEVWDVLEPWQATYWKNLPKGYRVRFQGSHNEWSIDSDTSPEWIEANDQANEWYWEFRQWYKDPAFD
ncbi:hypothetical protein QUB80_29085 [Chlorogloeopsis sp. ULAP01]|uniref:hypothetical protein n=1 Tax=Chlorogloeopsis sp. ULAP01 TaxID=3056483 RepID=UPI0025AB2F2F|nr:hypothetical protein [Chlorogloeopsis sp. ULAP01]MDM9384717.1 hypothetical protein [Chlorogloeopsis sp. ULAP01]